MNLGDIIARIQDKCPEFATVDHVLTSPADFARPAALVAPVSNRAAPPNIVITGGFAQDVASIVGVFIVIERRQSGSYDNGAADVFDTLTRSLRTALVNWNPGDLIQPITYAGGVMDAFQPGNVTWRDDYSAEFEMRFP